MAANHPRSFGPIKHPGRGRIWPRFYGNRSPDKPSSEAGSRPSIVTTASAADVCVTSRRPTPDAGPDNAAPKPAQPPIASQAPPHNPAPPPFATPAPPPAPLPPALPSAPSQVLPGPSAPTGVSMGPPLVAN